MSTIIRDLGKKYGQDTSGPTLLYSSSGRTSDNRKVSVLRETIGCNRLGDVPWALMSGHLSTYIGTTMTLGGRSTDKLSRSYTLRGATS